MDKFNTLCKELHIDSLHPSANDLNRLIEWCESSLSTDVYCDGDVQERFDFYQDLASGFLENIQPAPQKNSLTSPITTLNGITPLQLTVEIGLNVFLQTLNPSSDQINTKINGMTLLSLAAVHGHLHTIKILLKLGADLNEKSAKGEPLLFVTLMLPIAHDARMVENKQEIFDLLSHTSKKLLQERNESGDTILHLMSVYGYKQLIKKTLANRLKLASTPNNLSRYPIHSAILNGQHECVQLLIMVHNVKELVDSKGQNALHYAAKYGDKNMLDICLHSTLSKDALDKQHRTPLILATIAQNAEAVKILIDDGAQVNLTDDVHRCALHYAVESNDEASVKHLLESSNIDVNISDDYSQNPLDLVQEQTNEGNIIKNLLLEKGAIHGQDLTNSM